MTLLRRLLIAAATARTSLALTAAPSSAIVGGHDAAPGAYPSIVEITFGSSFLCTGTLIAPNYVLTAGHCGSMTGAAIGTPARLARAAHRRAHRLQQVRAGRERSRSRG